MTADAIDHAALGASRVALQYQNSPNFKAYLAALLGQANDVESLLEALAEISDIDLATGANLDVIGDIVGISRYVLNTLPVAFFGFAGQPLATRFGEEGRVDVGSRFIEEGEPAYANTVLTDDQFRLYIRARIVRNHAKGTIEDLISAMTYIFGPGIVLIDDIGGMAFNISIGRRLTFAEKTLLYLYSVMPKAAGVRINQRSYFDAGKVFGFAGYAYALGFGDENQFSTVVVQNKYDGAFKYDGTRDYRGQTVTHTFIGPPPMKGGAFAEEVNISL